MTRIEIVCVESLKGIANRNFIYESSHQIKNENDEQIVEYIELQIRSIALGCEGAIAKIQAHGVYTLPYCNMHVFHVTINNKERLFVGSVFKNFDADLPNGKIAKK